MAQKSHSQVSHNRRFATAVFGERQTVRQKVLLPLWVLVVSKHLDRSNGGSRLCNCYAF
jgi:hypothetical protein